MPNGGVQGGNLPVFDRSQTSAFLLEINIKLWNWEIEIWYGTYQAIDIHLMMWMHQGHALGWG